MKVEKDMEKSRLYKAFIRKYKQFSPILIFKTLEFANSLGKAFDALEDYNGELPVVWDAEVQKWIPEVLVEYEFLQGRD